MVGAVRGIDPETGHYFDDTKRYIDALDLPEADRAKVYSGNARRVYPRLDRPCANEDSKWLATFTARRRLARVRPEPAASRRYVPPPGRGRRPLPRVRPRRRLPVRAGAEVHAGRRGQGAAVRAARLPRLRPQRHRPGDLPRRRQQRPGRRAARGRGPGPRRGDHPARRLPRASSPTCTPPASAAIRFNFVKRLVDPKPDDYYRGLVDLVAEFGWHIVVYFEAADLAERWELFTSLPTAVVVDHMGRPDVSQPRRRPRLRAVHALHARARERLVQGELRGAAVGLRPAGLRRRRPVRAPHRRDLPRPGASGGPTGRTRT